MNKPLIISLPLPEYTIDIKPDYEVLGEKIDNTIAENFNGKDVAIRALSLTDHPKLNLDEFTELIVNTGTDKYDAGRTGVDHEVFVPYQPDFHAGFCTVGKNHVGEGADFIKKFYENAMLDRGYRLRIDLLLIYDLNQLIQANKVDLDKPSIPSHLEPYLFRFKYPDRKPDALLGIIKILR